MHFIEQVGFKSNSRVKAFISNFEEYSFHMHENVIEIICVLKGKYYISESAEDYILRSKEIFIFNPNDPHSIKEYEPSSVLLTVQIDQSHYIKNFDYKMFPYFICGSNMPDTQYIANTRYLRFLLAKILVEYSNENISERAVEAYTNDLYKYLLEQHRDYYFVKTKTGQIKILNRPLNGNIEMDPDRLHRIIDYIYANFRKKISLHKIAESEYLSVSYLSKYINQKSGLTFSEHLSLARCEEVERLLGNTNKTIDQIASDVGFSNRNHLAGQFKKWFNKTPTAYRRQIEKNINVSKYKAVNINLIEFKEIKSIIDEYLEGIN